MSSEDLKQHATSSHDFYVLLGVEFETSEADIKRAYRKTSLQYHPDKNPGKLDVIEKFHLLAIARDVLLDPEAKAAYDRARAARRAKEAQQSLFEGKRKQMKEDLENREKGFKRKRGEEIDAEEKLEREIRRLAEDGKRRRKEREERLNREKREEGASFMEEESELYSPPGVSSEVPEIDRTVKARWVREGDGASLNKEKLIEMFSKFGEIESSLVMKDKKMRIGGEKHKKVVATGFIVFKSIVSAHAAVEDAKRTFKLLESVFWANKEPDIASPAPVAADYSAPSTPASTPKSFRTSFPGIYKNGSGGIGAPSFSFSPQSPSLEEVTLMRLKQAERKRLEEQIRQKEAAEE
ncbi:DnaJ-domain-containing protein [Glonium stellatum]|uniref:DnaJ-domain-containing protein n=1 Tax=Glonium stellatum TaxID=574774 RepID=A0A8E2EUN1_9PEZI|nr:DnaJ-domain-containing protein [Glonium stellatum]